jgi:hypothetical protein
MEKVEVFRSGTHIDMYGREFVFTPEKIREAARRYNDVQYAQFRAPHTKGHPVTTGEPSYAWTKRLSTTTADDGAELLLVEMEDADEQFIEDVRKGRYVNRSISIHPETLFIDHIAWLGATQPAVGGMKHPFAFAGNTEGIATFELPLASFAAGDPEPVITPETEKAMEEKLDQLIALLTPMAENIQKLVDGQGETPAEEEGESGEFARAASGAALPDAERDELERFRIGAKIDADPGFVGKITPGNRDGIIDNVIRLNKLGTTASFARAKDDGTTETVTGGEGDAYLEAQKSTLPASFSSGQHTRRSEQIGPQGANAELQDRLPVVESRTRTKIIHR